MTATTGDGHFQVHFWPTERFGRWSVGSAVAFGVGLVAGLFDYSWLARGPAWLAAVGGLSALVSGVLAMIREHDRSIGVILSTLVGLMVALFMVFAE